MSALPVDVILVRHAMPVLVPEVSAEQWRLGPPGRAAARALGRTLEPGVVVSSDEPKAAETAAEIAAVHGAGVGLDHRFGEAHRPYVWTDDASYRDRARAYLRGESVEGWEPHAFVAARFAAALADHAPRALATGVPLIVVTHGLAMTLWAWSIGAATDRVAWWEPLGFPDAVRVAGPEAARLRAD